MGADRPVDVEEEPAAQVECEKVSSALSKK
jgi:hypothetical protein